MWTIVYNYVSILSTKNTKYMYLDIKNFYLCAPMERYEYMKMSIGIFPQQVIDQYNLMNKVYKGCIWIENAEASMDSLKLEN